MKQLSPLSYFELSVVSRTSQAGARHAMPLQSAICDFFVKCGIPHQEIVLQEGPQMSAVSVYTRSFKCRGQIRQHFKKNFPKGLCLTERLLVREDWFDKWQADYGIMPIGKSFVLVPEWKRKEYRSGKRTAIFLDPQGVSGSGQHPTTQIMVELLEKIAGKFETCLDLGTGTGILGILAAKLGAENVIAVDNDRRAVRAARVNFERNQIGHAQAQFGDVIRQIQKVPGSSRALRNLVPFDLVCANLISPVLEKIQKQLFRSVRPGGYLAVSGIHVLNFPAFHRKFRDSRFRCLAILKRRGWTGLLFKKRFSQYNSV